MGGVPYYPTLDPKQQDIISQQQALISQQQRVILQQQSLMSKRPYSILEKQGMNMPTMMMQPPIMQPPMIRPPHPVVLPPPYPIEQVPMGRSEIEFVPRRGLFEKQNG